MPVPLIDRIKRHIEMSGPLPVAEYMHWCMADIEAGYYKNRDAIGRQGDFITAPEVSQMFGELIGIWAIREWERLDKPKSFNLVELGPGKGTLMCDLLRASKVAPDFLDATDIYLIETSEKLIEQQARALQGENVKWVSSFSDVPMAPVIVIANEFLDVLPIRQYVKAAGRWSERIITLDPDGNLEWGLGAGLIDDAFLPKHAEGEPDGSIIEVSTTREAFVANIAERVSENSGAALFIDYGHEKTGFGDTFQAIKAHAYQDTLTSPGEADLTAHVDFEPLLKIAISAGVELSPLQSQKEFLLELGLLERAGQLGAGKPAAVQEALTKQAERLALPHEMGELFKVFSFRK